MNLKCKVMYQERYGAGEPSDDMVEAMYKDFPGGVRRVVAIGGGTVIDISKLFALKEVSPVLDYYDGKRLPEKARELVLVPTTCGTGSEVTNLAILALNTRGTKKGLAFNEMYADKAALIPELLRNLPHAVFAASSIDALVHGVESVLSPKANGATKMFGYKAIEMILKGYTKIKAGGEEAKKALLGDFLLASNYAGVSFANAGCAAVHAMSYPFGAACHVAHGESNYAIFSGVMKNYMELKRDGEIAVLNSFMAELLGCPASGVYETLGNLLDFILKRKRLSEYGVTPKMAAEFSASVIENQRRLLANNFVPFDRERILKIYTELL
jgi:4-hydroxybutyrate dehydrogenase